MTLKAMRWASLIICTSSLFAGCSDGAVGIGPSAPHSSSATPVGRSAGLTIYVTNIGRLHNSVTTYPSTADHDSAPLTTIEGGHTLLALPAGVAVDSSGYIYVAVVTNQVLVFTPGANGDVAPIHVIGGTATRIQNPQAIAFNHAGDLFVTTVGPSVVLEFAPNSFGDVQPIAAIGGTHTGFKGSQLSGLGFDSHDNIYVSLQGGGDFPTVTEFRVGSNGDARPIRTITGDLTHLASACGVAISPLDDIRVTDCGNGDVGVRVFGPWQNGNVAPKASLEGPKTGMRSPRGIAFDSSGRSYVADHTGQMFVYRTGERGDIRPRQRVSGPDTGLHQPLYIAVH